MGRTALTALIATLSLLAPIMVAAQEKADRPQISQTAIPAQDVANVTRYLGSILSIRSACDDAAWSLWQSNRYRSWRKGTSPILSLNYTARSFPQLPEPPAILGPELQRRFRETAVQTNEILKASQLTFKEMADYINASDFKDDKFKKGDILNEKLEGYGKTCFGLMEEFQKLYAETVTAAISSAMTASAQAATARIMMADWEQARRLSEEMAKGPQADKAKISAIVTALSELVNQRKSDFAGEMETPNSPIRDFYIIIFNDRITVPMRRIVREKFGTTTAFKDVSKNTPRSTFVSIREAIDIALPGTVLTFLAY